MTRVFDDPAAFVEGALNGFALAYQRYVARVDGGVVRRGSDRAGQVAVVIGGGSGHYPAFAGLVGTGLASGAVCGNVFSSPSAGQAYRVARAADNGGGILFSYGNYAGDRMQFLQAEERLVAEGVDVRSVVVTDDIASAGREQSHERRGIAGDLVVFKVAGAAAEAGAGLDLVERVAREANDCTRTLGIAFGGCTLPGADGPLFSVPSGQMSIGLGIHGEAGIRDVPMRDAAGIAEVLVSGLLEEAPAGSGERVVALLNGLGSVKYEELFVLFGHVIEGLASSGIEVADAECGELVTSLDMSGLSLTLFWPDEQLEALWAAPADAPAFRRPQRVPAPERRLPDLGRAVVVTEATEESRRLGALAVLAMEAASRTLLAHEKDLGSLDAVAGDGDHGVGMSRGAQGALAAARAALVQGAGVRDALVAAGLEWSERAGGTSGALWSSGLTRLGSTLGDKDAYSASDLVEAVGAAEQAVKALGGAEVGDKTLVDALHPFVERLRAEVGRGCTLALAIKAAAQDATRAAEATAPLRPKKGRARPLAERSIGSPDPGAVSFALVVSALAEEAALWAGDGPRLGGGDN